MLYYVIDITSLSPETQAYAEKYALSKECMTPEEREHFLNYLQMHDIRARIKSGESTRVNRPTWIEEVSSDHQDPTARNESLAEASEDTSDDSDDSENTEDDELRGPVTVIHSVNTTDEGIDFENEGFWFGKTRYQSPESIEEQSIEGFWYGMKRCQSPETIEEERIEGLYASDSTADNTGEPDKTTKRKRAISEPDFYEEQQDRGSATLEAGPRSDDIIRSPKRPRITSSRKLSSLSQEIAVRPGEAISAPETQASPPPPPSKENFQNTWPVTYAVEYPTYRGWE